MSKIEISSPEVTTSVTEIVWNGEVIWSAERDAHLPIRKLQFTVEAGRRPEIELTTMTRPKR